DSAGNVFIADTGNNRIRKITTDGNIGTVLDGLNQPQSVAVDASGAIYVADTGNDQIVKLSANGALNVVTQVLKPSAVLVDAAGNLWFSELTRVSKIDATGAQTTIVDQLKTPGGLALTGDGQLLIAETGANLIRTWTAQGGLSTIAGTGTQGFSG